MDRGHRGEEVVRAVVGLAQALGKRVVIEGIETRHQLDRLIELRCDRGQGFLLAHPSSAEVVTSLLKCDALYSAPEAMSETPGAPRLKVVTDEPRMKVYASA